MQMSSDGLSLWTINFEAKLTLHGLFLNFSTTLTVTENSCKLNFCSRIGVWLQRVSNPCRAGLGNVTGCSTCEHQGPGGLGGRCCGVPSTTALHLYCHSHMGSTRAKSFPGVTVTHAFFVLGLNSGLSKISRWCVVRREIDINVLVRAACTSP